MIPPILGVVTVDQPVSLHEMSRDEKEVIWGSFIRRGVLPSKQEECRRNARHLPLCLHFPHCRTSVECSVINLTHNVHARL